MRSLPLFLRPCDTAIAGTASAALGWMPTLGSHRQSSSKAWAVAPFERQANGARTLVDVPSTLHSPAALLRFANSMTVLLHGSSEPKMHAAAVSITQSLARSTTSRGIPS